MQKMISVRAALLGLVLAAAGCQPAVSDNRLLDDNVESANSALLKGMGGTNGDSDFCNNAGALCVNGEGDCDSTAQCAAGLTCVPNVGPRYGLPASDDICAPLHCFNRIVDGDEALLDCGGSCAPCPGTPPKGQIGAMNGSQNYCKDPSHLCGNGEGDCHSNAQCAAGLTCIQGVGAKYGLVANDDVCAPAHCFNRVVDGDEMLMDCGGSCVACAGTPPKGNMGAVNGSQNYCKDPAHLCANGEGDCHSNAQCMGGLTCVPAVGARYGLPAGDDVCAPAHCFNRVMDADETGGDCGGSTCLPCPLCADGIKDGRERGIDCGSYCGPCPGDPTCSDGIQNQGETGVDCGGPCTSCMAAPTCFDSIQNEGETGVDCGGPCTACPTCSDSIQNQSETGIDCGGTCPACPTCFDSIQNEGETGVDCGGPCTPCATCFDNIQNEGEGGIDCGGPCSACPNCMDGIQNESELGIDCGGPCTACQTCAGGAQLPICTNCDAGEYLTSGMCVTCSASCTAGNYESTSCSLAHDRACMGCATIINCTTETCSTSMDQTCTACAMGYTLVGGYCAANASITVDRAQFFIQPAATISLNVNNTSMTAAALNIKATFPGGLSDITQDATNCTNVPAGTSCTLKITSPTAKLHAPTSFTISGDNTNAAPAQIAVTYMPIAGGAVNAMAVDTTNRILYVGGAFTTLSTTSGPGVVMDTTAGSFVSQYLHVDHNIYTAITDGNHGWYIGGIFNVINGTTRDRVAHINADGSLDTAFNASMQTTATVTALALVGGKLYIGGVFTNVGGQPHTDLAAVDATTGAIASFTANADASVGAFLVHGTTLYVGGSFANLGGQPRMGIAAIDTTLGTVTGFNPGLSSGGNAAAFALSTDASTLYVGGQFTTLGGQSRANIGAVSTTTGLATTWSSDANSAVYALALSDTTLYVGGQFSTIGGGTFRNHIAALDTTTDMSNVLAFNPSAGSSVYGLAVSGTTLYAAGGFTTVAGVTRNRIAALDTTAVATATSFATNGFDGLGRVLALDGTNLFVGGDFRNSGYAARSRIGAIDLKTGQPTAFNPNVNNTVNVLLLSGTTLYAGGTFTTAGGTGRPRIAAFDTTTTGTLTPFNPSPNGTVIAMAMVDTTLYVGGSFTTIAGGSHARLVGLDTTKVSSATAFNLGVTAGSSVNSIVYNSSHSSIYVGGLFTQIGATFRTSIAEITLAGTGSVTAFDPAADGTINDMLLSNTNLFVAGTFTTAGGGGGGARKYLAQIDTTLNVNNATSYSTYLNRPVASLAMIGSTLYLSGLFQFAGIDGSVRNRIAAMDASTAAVTSFDPNADSNVSKLLADGTTLFMGGSFTTLANYPGQYLAMITQ